MSTTVRILPARAVARLLERELRHRWPGIRFAVRAGARHERRILTAAWLDGPAENLVADAVRRFEAVGAGHDARGPVRYGIHRVLTARTISPAGYALLADALERGYPLMIPRDAGVGVDWRAAHALTVEAPIELHGSTFGPLEGTYARTGDHGPVSAAYALRLLAETADLSDIDTLMSQP